MRAINLSVGVEDWNGAPVVTVKGTPVDGIILESPLLHFIEYGADYAGQAAQVAWHLHHSLGKLTGGASGHGLGGETAVVQQAAEALLEILWAMHQRGVCGRRGYAIGLHGLLADERALAHFTLSAQVGNPVSMAELLQAHSEICGCVGTRCRCGAQKNPAAGGR